MNAEIVMIGTELLLGQIVDTNAAHLGRVLAENGINLFQKTTVGDNPARMRAVLEGALERADVVLTSGGLGPTEDDLTREVVAEVTGRPLEFRDDLFARLQERFARVRRPLTANNRKQAMAPRGAHAIPNPNGTAPGLIVEDPRGVIACMPGVPHELHAMMDESVVPYVRERFGIAETLRYRVLKVCGLGESRVDELIGDLIREHDNPKIGLLASPESVRIRISARAADPDAADGLIDAVDAQVRQRLPGLVMGINDDTVESVVDALLAERGWRLAVAEAHTGGVMAQRLVLAGAATFAGGVTLPRGAGEDDLACAAQQNAEAVRARFEADCALGMATDPADRRCVACFICPQGVASWEFSFSRLDALNQLRGAVVSLEHVRRWLLGVPDARADAKT